MTTYNKTQLKTFFEQGDIPKGTDYANFIDSQVNIAESNEQMMAGNLNAPKIITSLVSATTVDATTVNATTVSAATFNTTTLNTTTLNTATANATIVSASTKVVTADVSASSTVYASALSTQVGNKGKVTIVSAAGTARATAAPMDISYMIRGQGVIDGTSTGYLLAVPVPGLTQYFFHEGVSANLYPVGSDYTINALASGSPFVLAAKTLYTIAHVTTSAYGVK